MLHEKVKEYFSKIGSKGGKKSRRILTAKQARAMVKAREAKKKSKAEQHHVVSGLGKIFSQKP